MSDLDRDSEAVETANGAFYAAFESGDLDAMTEVWLDDDEALCIHPAAPPVRGTRAINRSWALIMANTPYIQFFLTDVVVSVRGDVGFVTCTENVLTADSLSEDDTFAGARAIATNVFVREPGGWRLWIHHSSPVLSGTDHDD